MPGKWQDARRGILHFLQHPSQVLSVAASLGLFTCLLLDFLTFMVDSADGFAKAREKVAPTQYPTSQSVRWTVLCGRLLMKCWGKMLEQMSPSCQARSLFLFFKDQQLWGQFLIICTINPFACSSCDCIDETDVLLFPLLIRS